MQTGNHAKWREDPGGSASLHARFKKITKQEVKFKKLNTVFNKWLKYEELEKKYTY